MGKDWADYLDENGLVVQKRSLGGDGGDSLNRTCAAIILSRLAGVTPPSQEFEVYNQCLNLQTGKFRRNSHVNKWYSYWDRASRDQLTPLVILGGLTSPYLLKIAFRDHLKRLLLFTTNTRRNFVYPTLEEHQKYSTPDVPWDYSWKLPDLTIFEFWALYIRGFKHPALYPFLLILDLHTLIGAIVLRFQKENDVINHALVLEYAKVRMDTVWMKLARKIASRAFLQPRLDSFFGVEIEPPINDIYRSL